MSAETQLNASEGNVAGKGGKGGKGGKEGKGGKGDKGGRGGIGGIRDTTEIGNIPGASRRSKITSQQDVQ